MRITVVFNSKAQNTEDQAKLLFSGTIADACQNLTEQKHTITPVELSGRIDEVIKNLIDSKPDVIIKIKPNKGIKCE